MAFYWEQLYEVRRLCAADKTLSIGILIDNHYFITSKRLGFSKWKEAYFPFAKKLWGDIRVTGLIDSRGELNDEQVKEKLDREMANEEAYKV